MKKLLILFLILALPCIAEARMNVGIVGGGVTAAASCSTSNDGILFGSITGSTSTASAAYMCTRKEALGSNSTLTGFLVHGCSTGNGGNVTASLYTESSTVPGTEVTGTVSETVAATTWTACTDYSDVFLAVSPVKAITAATYWVCISDPDSGLRLISVSSAGQKVTYGATPTTSPTDDYFFTVEAWGCTP